MELKVIIHTNDEAHTKEVSERLVKENLNNKLDSYLKKFDDKSDAEGQLELKIEKNKTERFNGILQVNLDGDAYRYEREDYKNLDDLINHLFDHLKEGLSK